VKPYQFIHGKRSCWEEIIILNFFGTIILSDIDELDAISATQMQINPGDISDIVNGNG
jgi:hypothetical protein